MISAARRRYPHTLMVLATIAVITVVVVVTELWMPAILIFIGGFWLGLLVLAVREDRQQKR